MTDRRLIAWAVAAVAAVVAFGGCGPVNRLQDCDFDNHTAAVVVTAPPAPFLSGRANVSAMVPGRAPIRADHSSLMVDLSVLAPTKRRQIRARIDSASTHLDAAARITQKTLAGMARDLGCQPIDEPESADYLLHIDVRDYGFFMNRLEFTDFWISADMHLIDQREGRRVWERKVQEMMPASDVMAGLHVTLGYRNYNRVAAFAELSVEEMTAVLEHVADVNAATLTAALLNDVLASQ